MTSTGTVQPGGAAAIEGLETAAAVEALAEMIQRAYHQKTGLDAAMFVSRPVEGAAILGAERP